MIQETIKDLKNAVELGEITVAEASRELDIGAKNIYAYFNGVQKARPKTIKSIEELLARHHLNKNKDDDLELFFIKFHKLKVEAKVLGGHLSVTF